MANLRRAFERRLDKKQDALPAMPGILGDPAGRVETSLPNVVYVQVAQTVTTAICTTVPHIAGLPVWVGYAPHMPDKLQVISQRIIGGAGTDETQAGVPPHAASHEWYGEGAIGGTDIIKVHLQQFMPLRVFIHTELTVGIYPGLVWGTTGWVMVADTNVFGMPVPKTLDLKFDAPTTVDKSRYVLITINTSGALVKTRGTEVDTTALTLSDIPTAPAGTQYILAAVRLYFGQMELVENRNGTDIVDLRFPLAHFHDNIASWNDITGVPQAFFPTPHAGSHIEGAEYDEITSALNALAYPMRGGPLIDVPAAGRAGVFWYASDVGKILRDNGSTWDIVSVTKFLDLVGLRASSNPSSPSSGDLIYRTDLLTWAVYDGNRWLSQSELSLGKVDITFSADGSVKLGKLRTDRTPYVVRVSLLTHVATTNDGTNYWTITVRGRDAALSASSNVHQIDTSAHTVATYTESDAAPSVTGSPANDSLLDIAAVKTGSPGTLTVDVMVYYRYQL